MNTVFENELIKVTKSSDGRKANVYVNRKLVFASAQDEAESTDIDVSMFISMLLDDVQAAEKVI